MDKAFLELLSQKDFVFITVKEICEKAGVNRSTFYLHYETVADLLSESADYVYEQFMNYMDPNSRQILDKLNECTLDELNFITPEYLMPYLKFVKENKRLFKTVTENSGILRMDESYDKMFVNVFTPILERFRVPSCERTYMMAFYVRGLIAVITEWINQDCSVPAEDIISVIRRCIMRSEE